MPPLKDYYELTKPGIIYGNAITTIAGFFLASHGQGSLGLLLAALVGLSFVIASGCVFNNYIDRDIDARMVRTKDRPLVTGRISNRAAIIFGTCLGILGFSILFLYTNLLTVAVAFVGYFFYIVMYSLWFKRRSVYGAAIGSIAGAVPPVVGYCAASNRFDAGAIILFLILALWQMPHFFAISIRRADDYAAAGIPVLPVQRGVRRTKITMLLYIIMFGIVAVLPTIYGYTGYAYFAIALFLALAWFTLCISGFWASDDKKWAYKMFLFSLVVMMTLFITMIADAALR